MLTLTLAYFRRPFFFNSNFFFDFSFFLCFLFFYPYSSTCYQNPATMPPASILIDCPYVYAGSSVAGAAVAMAVIGAIVCAFILYLANQYREEKVRAMCDGLACLETPPCSDIQTRQRLFAQVLRRSQLIFIFIFLLGAIFMNLTVLAFYGPNDNTTCMNRVWLFNLSSTVMYAPLIMKLHRVEMFYRQVQRGHRRKNISDSYVLIQVRVVV